MIEKPTWRRVSGITSYVTSYYMVAETLLGGNLNNWQPMWEVAFSISMPWDGKSPVKLISMSSLI